VIGVADTMIKAVPPILLRTIPCRSMPGLLRSTLRRRALGTQLIALRLLGKQGREVLPRAFDGSDAQCSALRKDKNCTFSFWQVASQIVSDLGHITARGVI
jgi:hypothetical protein